MRNTPFFNAHHSPIGAFASFTFGCKGGKGGLGLELIGPANENILIGAQDAVTPDKYVALPFFDELVSDEANYDVELAEKVVRTAVVEKFSDDLIRRSLRASSDEWTAGDLTFKVISPVLAVPDPALGDSDELLQALCPAVLAELTLDNRLGSYDRKVFFGYSGSDRSAGMRVFEEKGVRGVGQGLTTALATLDDMTTGLAWDPLDILEPSHASNLTFMLGSIGMLVGVVPAGQTKTFKIAICFHRGGVATAGLRTRYLYNRWFESIEEVASFALGRFDRLKAAGLEADDELSFGLSQVRALTVAHAVRSYFGSTQLLEGKDGEPLWVVNEGEYRMMNTLDLTADQLFFELRMNPWTVRNELDLYTKSYSYTDTVRFFGDPEEHPGGIAFTHDEGISNVFSRPGYSAYEKAGLTGCFSYMSCEELTNWVLCATTYVLKTGDREWGAQNLEVLANCFESLLNRDHPDALLRDGVMDLDSTRCKGGAEITTYDSLDVSLGQARRNLYLAVKWWASFVLLSEVFGQLERPRLSLDARRQAERTASTVVSYADAGGLLPAILEEGSLARIIPAIEPLIFPLELGIDWALDRNGQFGSLISALEVHLRAILVPGVCKFADGGWKLSSTSENSWLSKIYLCQEVAQRLFGIDDPEADLAHWNWLMDPENVYFAWSDQMLSGIAVGSRYYPRGVTSVLWTQFRALAGTSEGYVVNRAMINA
jgi:hypothetical protein